MSEEKPEWLTKAHEVTQKFENEMGVGMEGEVKIEKKKALQLIQLAVVTIEAINKCNPNLLDINEYGLQRFLIIAKSLYENECEGMGRVKELTLLKALARYICSVKISIEKIWMKI